MGGQQGGRAQVRQGSGHGQAASGCAGLFRLRHWIFCLQRSACCGTGSSNWSHGDRLLGAGHPGWGAAGRLGAGRRASLTTKACRSAVVEKSSVHTCTNACAYARTPFHAASPAAARPERSADEKKFLEARMAFAAGQPVMSNEEFDQLKATLAGALRCAGRAGVRGCCGLRSRVAPAPCASRRPWGSCCTATTALSISQLQAGPAPLLRAPTQTKPT